MWVYCLLSPNRVMVDVIYLFLENAKQRKKVAQRRIRDWISRQTTCHKSLHLCSLTQQSKSELSKITNQMQQSSIQKPQEESRPRYEPEDDNKTLRIHFVCVLTIAISLNRIMVRRNIQYQKTMKTKEIQMAIQSGGFATCL